MRPAFAPLFKLPSEIIETYWNVNCCQVGISIRDLDRNNRNILECKFIICPLCFTVSLEIIETYWNVNDDLSDASISHLGEIIETYWNVNLLIGFLRIQSALEIIETYWNVN